LIKHLRTGPTIFPEFIAYKLIVLGIGLTMYALLTVIAFLNLLDPLKPWICKQGILMHAFEKILHCVQDDRSIS
jgi:hypothetical protein